MSHRPVLFAILAAASVAPAPAAAQSAPMGCSILGDLAWSYTVARLTEYNRGLPSNWLPTNVDYNNLQVCDSPSLAASGGYAAAMAHFGTAVRWSYFDNRPGCSQVDIDACFPLPQSLAASLADAAFARQIWTEIRGTVSVHMPYGTASGRSFFTVDSLVQSLAGQGPLQRRFGSVSR